MPGTQRAPGGTRKPSEDKTNRGVGKFLSKPWWAGISAIAGVLAVGGAIAAVIAILPSGQHATQSTSAAAPIQFSNLSEIKLARYGLIFSYPSDWDLQYTPENRDGAEFINPNDGAVSITGYGTHGDLPANPTIFDVQKEWEKLIIPSLKNPRIIESAPSGTFAEDARQKYPVDGWRVVYQYVNDHGRSMTDMVKSAYANGREVDLVMEAPTSEFHAIKKHFFS